MCAIIVVLPVFDTQPLTGEEVEKIVAQLFKINAAVVKQLKEILE